MEKLTVEQRRMVIDYYATKLVEEWPAELSGMEVEKKLTNEVMALRYRLDKTVNAVTFNNLIEFMLDQQTFDRNPADWLNENGHEVDEVTQIGWKVYLEDMISSLINDIAGV